MLLLLVITPMVSSIRQKCKLMLKDIKKKTQSLIQVSMKLGEAVYKSQQKPDQDDKGSGKPKDSKPTDKDNVVDADFEDVKEDKEKSA